MKEYIDIKLLNSIIERNGGVRELKKKSGLSLKTIKKILSGETNYKITSLFMIVDALQIPLKELIL